LAVFNIQRAYYDCVHVISAVYPEKQKCVEQRLAFQHGDNLRRAVGIFIHNISGVFYFYMRGNNRRTRKHIYQCARAKRNQNNANQNPQRYCKRKNKFLFMFRQIKIPLTIFALRYKYNTKT
jgi:hypothetical protein